MRPWITTGLLLLAVVQLSSCGSSGATATERDEQEEHLAQCRSLISEHWDIGRYLVWRSADQAIQNNSFAYALPCSSQVSAFFETGATRECPEELEQLHEWIGKHDQFLPGWDGLINKKMGNRITAYVEIDSVKNITSPLRDEYQAQCLGD